MPRQLPLPHELGPIFGVRDARHAGVSEGRLRGRDLTRSLRGVRVNGRLESVAQLCTAAAARMTGTWCFSHATAAVLHGMPLPRALETVDAPVHIAVRAPRSAPEAAGIVGHRLHASSIRVVIRDGFPVASPADTFCQLASTLGVESLVAVGDFLLAGDARLGRHRVPLANRAELADAALRHRGKRGAKSMAWALERLRDGVDSRPESLLRLRLVAAGLPEPIVHLPVAVDGGRRSLHPDLALPRWLTSFEFQGDDHRTDRQTWLRDIERRELFRIAGWYVIEVTAHDLYSDRAAFLRRVYAVLRSRGYPG